MNTTNDDENIKVAASETKSDIQFKRPILIGKIGRLPRKISQQNSTVECTPQKTTGVPKNSPVNDVKHDTVEEDDDTVQVQLLKAPAQQIPENNNSLPYKEPVWSGLPKTNGKDYIFEVLKNGSIIEIVNLMERPFWVFGRLATCNICMQHPTISRYHAVLQYRCQASDTEAPGFYIYDLGSTHGTFLNKHRLKPKVYARIQVGHILKLGCSTRSYILSGPKDDEEEESELTVTELKQKRAEELLKREEEAKEAAYKEEKETEERRKKEEEKGVDWGLGEDADEETDLSENPFAETTNEELYLDDPKKALRGFYEREGLDLEYDCNEQGIGQFLCKVELPIDDELGRPVVAEVLHKGKKKEAVVQCALEACRILDRHGLLRQATHESRKRKAKNWEENDYYDSDEDTFLDRTGTIEKKREKRMHAKAAQKAETYESLLEKEKIISASITDLEKKLAYAQAKNNAGNSSTNEEDSLDTFMKELKDSKPDRQAISKLKLELTRMKGEHANIIRLVNIAKPATLPELVPQYASAPSTSKDTKQKIFPIIGKRKKVKVQLPAKPASEQSSSNMDVEEEDEEEIDEVEHKREEKTTTSCNTENAPSEETERSTDEVVDASADSSSNSSSDDELVDAGEFSAIKTLHNTMTFKKFEKILKKGLPPFADKHQEKLEKILHNLKKLAANEDRMHVDWKILAAKKRKVMKLISDLRNCEPNEKLEHKVSSELNRILTELNTMTEQKYKVIDKVKRMGNEIKNISEAIDKDFKEYKKEMSKSLEVAPEASTSSIGDDAKHADSNNDSQLEGDTDEKVETDEKKRKKNQRRIQQRQERAEIERQRGYEEDATREDYSMWVPPTDQTGDGRTSLNDKLGY